MEPPTTAIPAASKLTRKTSSLDREGWWRTALTSTPIPGTYHLKTFIEESLLNPVIATYNFKNEGRRKPPLVQRNNPVVNDLPQYMPPDFLDLLKKQMATYSFKDKPRPSPSTLVYKDKRLGSQLHQFIHHLGNTGTAMLTALCQVLWKEDSLELSPGQYELLPAPVPKYASRSFVFRSSVQRFPTGCFTPREGPGPGHYDLKIPSASSVTSCFQSRVPRFLPACSKTPGPGAYTASAQFPKQPGTIAKMGREHSLFFNNTIGF
uniref:Sperm-tail PG-rich repeat containing 4 n=1 Tax=Equus asinus TaxID=9793 RepID=A0A9L0IM14_EQUAS|nr:protein STPG4 isoform X1 [Equus asinus]